MSLIENAQQLEETLATPNAKDIDVMSRVSGDILILGAGGKMGPSLARRIKRASDAAGTKRRIIAVSRFSSPDARISLENLGIEVVSCDLLDRTRITQLPQCENVYFLAGRKFGSTDRTDLTWAINAWLPGIVAEQFRSSRLVAFSTGNVYPFVDVNSGGSIETDEPKPVGEYAQSCLARERVFEYFSRDHGLRCLIFRLNYAVDLRYGVLVDIARSVFDGRPVNLSVSAFNVIWQGDANSYALRSIELCESPPRILNVTGPETISTRQTAEFFAGRFNRKAVFEGDPSDKALLNNAGVCHQLLGPPSVSLSELMEMVAHWIETGGTSLNKPTHFEVVDGKF
ncbi:MAG: NAD-dependent epimerase/dehydratase family protein [Acidobacteria bacterium]|nr:NAD-dependent epimerase/dehydratase family protein [Acidobacteriota bacterium]